MTPDELKSFRLSLGLTRNEFAKKIGYSAKAVETWEYGVRTIQPRLKLVINGAFKVRNQS